MKNIDLNRLFSARIDTGTSVRSKKTVASGSSTIENAKFAVMLQRKRLSTIAAAAPNFSSNIFVPKGSRQPNGEHKVVASPLPKSGDLFVLNVPKEPLVRGVLNEKESALVHIPKTSLHSMPVLPKVISSKGTGGNVSINTAASPAQVGMTSNQNAMIQQEASSVWVNHPTQMPRTIQSAPNVVISQGELKGDNTATTGTHSFSIRAVTEGEKLDRKTPSAFPKAITGNVSIASKAKPIPARMTINPRVAIQQGRSNVSVNRPMNASGMTQIVDDTAAPQRTPINTSTEATDKATILNRTLMADGMPDDRISAASPKLTKNKLAFISEPNHTIARKAINQDRVILQEKSTAPAGRSLKECGVTQSTNDIAALQGSSKGANLGISRKFDVLTGVFKMDGKLNDKFSAIKFFSSGRLSEVANSKVSQNKIHTADIPRPLEFYLAQREVLNRRTGAKLSPFGGNLAKLTISGEGSPPERSGPSQNQMRQPLPELREITSQQFRTTPFTLSSEELLESPKGEQTLADAKNAGGRVNDQPKESVGEPKAGNISTANDSKELKSPQEITTTGKQAKGEAKNSADSKAEATVPDVLKPRKKGDWIEQGKPLSAKIHESSGNLHGNASAVKNLTTNRIPLLESEIERILTIKSLVDKIRGRAQLLKSGETAVFEARLNPPKLGVVQIQMEVQGDQIRLTFAAERPEAVAALQEARGELASLVNQQGYTLTHCDIESRFSQSRWTESGQGVYRNRRSFDENAMEDGDSSVIEDQKDQRRSLNLGYNTMDLVA